MKGGKGNWNNKREKWSVEWNRGGDRSWGWGYIRKDKNQCGIWEGNGGWNRDW